MAGNYVYINDQPRQDQENREKANTTTVFLATVISIQYLVSDKIFMLELDGHGRNRTISNAPLYEDAVAYRMNGPIRSGDIVQVTLPNGNLGSRYATRVFSPKQNSYIAFKTEYRNLAKAMI